MREMKIKSLVSYICYLVFVLLIGYALYIECAPNMSMTISGRIFVGLASVFLLLIASCFRISLLKSESTKTKTMRITLWILFALYVFYLVMLLFFDTTVGRGFPNLDYSYFHIYLERSTNFIPFKTILYYVKELFKGELRYPLMNLLGNIFAFFPMGLFIPLLFPSFNKIGKFLIFIFTCLILTESIQMLFMVGSCDIDDIILNAIGAIAAFALIKAKLIQALTERLYIKGKVSAMD